MRKFLVGCSIVSLISIFAICGSCYYIGSKISDWGKQIQTLVESVPVKVKESNATPFAKPESIEISPERFILMIEARKKASAAIRETQVYTTIQGKMGALEVALKDKKPLGEVLSPGELFSITTNGVTAADHSLQKFFAALKEQQMSYDEYKYLSGSALALLLLEVPNLRASGQLSEKEADRLELLEASLQDFKYDLDEYREQWKQADPAVYQDTLKMLLAQKDDVKDYFESLAVDLMLHISLTNPDEFKNMNVQK